MCHSHHQCNPVCGGVCQAHHRLHGPLSERPDHPPQSRSVHDTNTNTSPAVKNLHIVFWHITVRSLQQDSQPAVWMFIILQTLSWDTEICCHMINILPSSGSWLHRVQPSHASNMTGKRCMVVQFQMNGWPCFNQPALFTWPSLVITLLSASPYELTCRTDICLHVFLHVFLVTFMQCARQ